MIIHYSFFGGRIQQNLTLGLIFEGFFGRTLVNPEQEIFMEEQVDNIAVKDDDKQKVVVLMEKRDRLVQEISMIEEQIVNICGSISDARDLVGKSRIGRPKGSTNKRSLDSIILDTISNNPTGVNMQEIAKNITSEGYTSNSSPKNFINIIRSRLSVLKRNKKIVRCDSTDRYKKLT